VTVLITGGAGYIGAHVVRLLCGRGDDVVIVDDLVTGHTDRVKGVPVVQLDLSLSESVNILEELMREYGVTSVVHFAARKQVGESVERPAWYFAQNIGSLANLLLAMERVGLQELVFSSSAAVYGASEGPALREDAPTRPINPYGETKLIGEWLVADAVRAFGFRSVSLRYFNVAGAGWPDLGDTAVLNLVPMVFERLESGRSPLIFGENYDTPDGTCIRDYIHVLDLAEAHLAALDSLHEGDSRHDIFNVGTGVGSSVKEMVTIIRDVSGIDLEPVVLERRVGDPAAVVADVSEIKRQIGWSATRDIRDIVESAWEAHRLSINR
jgi:UDP-glucose 4-epimerase